MTRRKVEIFTAGCSACVDVVALVKRIAGDCCDLSTLDMRQSDIARRARELGIRRVPAVVVDGELVECCAGGPREEALRAAGIGRAA